jgi:hypothetical protein
VGGRGWSEKLFSRKVVGVPNGDGRSGSIQRFALSEVRNAIVVALAKFCIPRASKHRYVEHILNAVTEHTTNHRLPQEIP